MDCRQKSDFLKSEIIQQELAYQGKWLGMKLVTYTVGEKVIPNYESVFRTTKKSNCRTDGVQIIPIIKYKDRKPEVVVIANFRPPVKSFCLQFPSGLVEDDKYQQNIRRELLEQTGYVVSKMIQFPLPTLYIDPWKSNQSSLMFVGIIDGDDPNHLQKQELESSENIRVLKFTLDQDFPKTLSQYAEKENYLIEGKIWSTCVGLVLNSVLNG